MQKESVLAENVVDKIVSAANDDYNVMASRVSLAVIATASIEDLEEGAAEDGTDAAGAGTVAIDVAHEDAMEAQRDFPVAEGALLTAAAASAASEVFDAFDAIIHDESNPAVLAAIHDANLDKEAYETLSRRHFRQLASEGRMGNTPTLSPSPLYESM